jgi:membrane protease subunit HflC
LRFGEIQDVKTEPGLYFKAPFAFAGFDTVQIIEDRVLRLDLNDQPPVQVSGGRFYEVDAFLTFKITDARRFRETVSGDITSAESRLRTRFDAALRRIYGLRSFEAALSAERTEMMREVRDLVRPDAQSLGLTVEDVRIVRTDLTARGFAADLRPHEGRTSCRGRTHSCTWPRGGAPYPRRCRPPGHRDRCRSAARIRNPAR